MRAHYPAEFMAAVLANGGGFYHPFAYVAEAMRMGLTVLPPDVNASELRCTGRGRELRIGLQVVLHDEFDLLLVDPGLRERLDRGQADAKTVRELIIARLS